MCRKVYVLWAVGGVENGDEIILAKTEAKDSFYN